MHNCIILFMKKICVLFLLSIGLIAGVSDDALAYVERENAIVRIMNKAAGKVQTITMPVGRDIQFEKLQMLVRSCKQSDPFDAENYFAFIEISKSDEGKIFSNWMNANEPGENPLQNADYDVWLVKCE